MGGCEFRTSDGIVGDRYLGGCGDRPPIVFVHGGTMAGWGWDLWARELAEQNWDCYAFDWLTHGRSARLSEQDFVRRSIQDVARREIPAVVDYATGGAGRRAIIIGHSMGGLAAQTYAAEHSRRVQAAVFVSPVVPIQVKQPADTFEVPFGVPFAPFPYDLAKHLFFTTMTDAQAHALYARLTPESPRAVWEASRWTAWVDLDRLRMPVMVMAAAEDTLVPPASAEKLAELLGARHEVVPGVGHVDILLKDPAAGQADWREGVRRVEEWLEAVTEGPSRLSGATAPYPATMPETARSRRAG